MKSWWQGMVAALGLLAMTTQAAEVVNVYSQRQAYLIDPILAAFSQQTGIKVNSVYLEDGLAERLAREGELTPADLVLDGRHQPPDGAGGAGSDSAGGQ